MRSGGLGLAINDTTDQCMTPLCYNHSAFMNENIIRISYSSLFYHSFSLLSTLDVCFFDNACAVSILHTPLEFLIYRVCIP